MAIQHVNAISNRLSLRPPQRDSLAILARVCEIASLAKDADPAAALQAIKGEFHTLRANNYTAAADENVRDFRTPVPEGERDRIGSMVFGGFGKPWSYLLIPHDGIREQMTLAGLAARHTYSSRPAQ